MTPKLLVWLTPFPPAKRGQKARQKPSTAVIGDRLAVPMATYRPLSVTMRMYWEGGREREGSGRIGREPRAGFGYAHLGVVHALATAHVLDVHGLWQVEHHVHGPPVVLCTSVASLAAISCFLHNRPFVAVENQRGD
jgi:hypothetical protein